MLALQGALAWAFFHKRAPKKECRCPGPYKSGGERSRLARWMDRLSWELVNAFPSTVGTCCQTSHHAGRVRIGALGSLSHPFPPLGLHSLRVNILIPRILLYVERLLVQRKEGSGPALGLTVWRGLIASDFLASFHRWTLQTRPTPPSRRPACLTCSGLSLEPLRTQWAVAAAFRAERKCCMMCTQILRPLLVLPGVHSVGDARETPWPGRQDIVLGWAGPGWAQKALTGP